MGQGLALIAKGVLITVCAAVAAWAYVAALMLSQGHDMDWITGGASRVSLLVALAGTFAIGLPIALFTYRFSAKHLSQSPTTLAMVAVLAGIMMVLASYVVADEAGVIALGIPAFIAAITYAVLGWFWVLRPSREAARD